MIGRRRTTRCDAREYGLKALRLALLCISIAFIPQTASFQVSHRPATANRLLSLVGQTPASIYRPSQPTSRLVLGASSSADDPGNPIGDWEYLEGNYLLRPPIDQGPPRALIHFLGGALVGAGPHVSYRYVLERLAAKGYLIVATPYNLSFDYLTTCDVVISSFERIAGLLARTYGGLPVVGIVS